MCRSLKWIHIYTLFFTFQHGAVSVMGELRGGGNILRYADLAAEKAASLSFFPYK